MASLMNGLSAMGAGLASFAGAAGLEAQKAELAQQSMMLADQLATVRESAGRQEAGKIAEAAQGRQFGFQAGESAADRALRISEGAAQRASEEKRTGMTVGADTPEIKNAKWWTDATPEQRQAYREELAAKAGLPAWLNTPSAPASPSGGASPTQPGAPAAPAPVTGVPDTAQPTRNDKALEGLPGPAASLVKGMVEGRIAPPSSFAASKPYWQALIAKATEYDPTFDETSWTGRVATRKDFASGQSAKAVTAMNTALGHAGTLLDDFEKLNNFGGVATVLNAPVNMMEKAFGDARQTKAQQTIDALASEARKVFAATGGGNLTELQEWQKSFPLNGSPDQQKAALTGFVELLDGRLQALADQYNRGMNRTDDPVNLLQPKSRAIFEKLTGKTPDNATGYQLGKPPSQTGPSAAAASQDAEAAAMPGAPRAIAPVDPAAREIGKSYPLPNGKIGVWRGGGWELIP